MFTNPDEFDFKDFFARDFPYSKDPAAGITDDDLEKAIGETTFTINTGIFPNQEMYNYAFLYLSAHFLVSNIRNSTQGLSGQYEGILTSKSVGSVAVGMSLPDSLLSDPNYAWLMKTTYGQKYLQIAYPLFQGNMFVVVGKTQP